MQTGVPACFAAAANRQWGPFINAIAQRVPTEPTPTAHSRVDHGKVLQLMAATGREAFAIALEEEGDRFAVAWAGGRIQVRL